MSSAKTSLLASIIFIAACTPQRVTTFDPGTPSPERTPPSAIRFYEVERPRCAFKEIGHINTRTGLFSSWHSVVRKTRERASEMGGDAVVAIRESSRVSGATVTQNGIGIHESTSLAGTVIRFTNPACRE